MEVFWKVHFSAHSGAKTSGQLSDADDGSVACNRRPIPRVDVDGIGLSFRKQRRLLPFRDRGIGTKEEQSSRIVSMEASPVSSLRPNNKRICRLA